MPHRLPLISFAYNYLTEILGMVAVGVYSATRYVAAMMNEDTWEKVKGSEGALFGAVIVVIVLWASKVMDGRRLDARHAETLALQKENSQKLMDLTAESIKAHGLTCQTIASVDRTLQAFQEAGENSTKKIVDAMKGKSCHAQTIKEMFPNFPKPETKTE
jgi:hypothetical protein